MRAEDDPSEDASRAAAFDFLNDLLEDRDAGRVKPIGHYLSRYTEHQDEIVREYVRFLESERADSSLTLPEGSFGPYRLLRHLGSGGQGEVWLAEDPRLGRQVAIKRLLGLVTVERRARLEREARATARLAHPGIGSLLDAQFDGDEPYLVMEYIEGEDLSVALVRAADHGAGPWLPKTQAHLTHVARVFAKLCDALHAAHETGLVHRDVKPGNLRLTPSGDPVLLDFGLALDSGGDARLTREGDVFGTPAYMSPEQVRGATGDALGPATDVYSAGVSLFEALTGAPPFTGATRHELEQGILQQPLPVARVGAWTLPKDVQAVLQCACDRDRSRRYANAAAFAADLRRLAAGEPVQARPVGPLLRLARWARREPVVATALGGVLFSLTSALAVTLVLLGMRDEALQVALGEQLTSRVPELMRKSPAAALALGVEAHDLADGLRTRSALYGPLETSMLLAWCAMPDGHSAVDNLWNRRTDELLVLGMGGKLLAWAGVNGTEPRLVATVPFVTPSLGRMAWVGSQGQVAYALESGEYGMVDTERGTLEWSVHDPDFRWLALEAGPSGQTIALLSPEETRLVRTSDGALLEEITAPFGTRPIVHFSPGGDLLLTGGAGSDADLWCVEDGSHLASLRGHGDEVRDAAFDPSGQRIASVSADGTLRLWDARNGAPLVDPLFLEGALETLAFGPRGRWLAAGTDGGTESGTWLVDMEGDAEPRFLAGHRAAVQALAFDGAGLQVASGSSDRTIRIWPVDSDLPGIVCRGRLSPNKLFFADDGRSLFVGDLLNRLRRFRSKPAPYAYELVQAQGPIVLAAFDPAGTRVLTARAQRGSGLRLWAAPAGEVVASEPAPGELLSQRLDFEDPVTGVAFAQGSGVATYSSEGHVAVWDLEQPNAPALIDRIKGPLRACEWFGRRLYAIDRDGILQVAQDPVERGTLDFVPSSEPSLASSPLLDLRALPDLGLCAFLHEGRQLLVLDPARETVVGQSTWGIEEGSSAIPTALGFAAGSRAGWVAVRCVDRSLRAFDIAALAAGGKPYQPAEMASLRAVLAVFTGDYLAVADTKGVGRVQGLPLGPVPRRLLAEYASYPGLQISGTVTCLASDGESGLAATGSESGQISVWRVSDGEAITQNGRHGAPIVAVEMSSGAGPLRVLSVDSEGSVRVWPVWPGEPARQQMGRELDVYERETALGK